MSGGQILGGILLAIPVAAAFAAHVALFGLPIAAIGWGIGIFGALMILLGVKLLCD